MFLYGGNFACSLNGPECVEFKFEDLKLVNVTPNAKKNILH